MTLAEPEHSPETWITAAIRDFCRGPENSLQDETNEPAWDEPLVGFARGDDPIFAAYKEHAGPEHWTPWEVFSATFPEIPVGPTELTVVCWVLPQTAPTRADNRRETEYPAERWARSRIYGETFNSRLRRQVADTLTAAGHEAIAPQLSPRWESVESTRFTYSSTWSERHAAYAAGLGTFGLCDGLITPRGKAVRVGTVVSRIRVPPTPRIYTDHRAYCLFFARGTCGDCMARCPVGAITETGHDKKKCRAHLKRTEGYVRATYGFDGYGCGLCQTGVPCESRVPTTK